MPRRRQGSPRRFGRSLQSAQVARRELAKRATADRGASRTRRAFQQRLASIAAVLSVPLRTHGTLGHERRIGDRGWGLVWWQQQRRQQQWPSLSRRVRHGKNDGDSDREPNAALTETRIRTEATGFSICMSVDDHARFERRAMEQENASIGGMAKRLLRIALRST
jgi:hypothetical protein